MKLLAPSLISWRMMTDNMGRFLLSALGVAFAVMIMFMQMGFYNGQNDSQANLGPILDADLIISSKWKEHLKSGEEITIKRLRQALALDEVSSVTPVYTNGSYWRNPQDSSRNRVLVIAVSLDNPGISTPEIKKYKDRLRLPGAVLYDRLSRKELGEVKIGTRTQLKGEPVTVVGLFELGPNMAYEGNVIISHENFYRIYSDWGGAERVADQISLGMIKLKKGADPLAVREKLKAQLPDDFITHTPDEIYEREKTYTAKHSPGGIVFGIGLNVAFIIGVIICYQILFNEVQDHLPQFATLKAIGHRTGYIFGIVVNDALILSLAGFIPGLAGSWLLYKALAHLTQLVFFLTPARIGLILGLTTVMCLLSAAFAMYKLIAADPADLY